MWCEEMRHRLAILISSCYRWATPLQYMESIILLTREIYVVDAVCDRGVSTACKSGNRCDLQGAEYNMTAS